jgi:tetratricopeptide (TPR) repeat protein
VLYKLYGREFELAQLLAAFEATKRGKPQLVWLEGEPGSGKTRLLQEFYSRLQTQLAPEGAANVPYWPALSAAGIDGDRINPIVQPRPAPQPIPYLWWGLRCTAGSEHSPDSFQAYIDSVDQLESQLGGIEAAQRRKRAGLSFAAGMAELITGLVTPLKVFYGAAKLVKALHDDLKNIQSGAAVSSDLKESSKRTEDIFLQLIASLNPDNKQDAQPIPLVILIDDAHWIDARSVAFTRRLMHLAHAKGWQVLLVLSLRDTELAAQSDHAGADVRLPASTVTELRSSLVRSFGAACVTEIALPAELGGDAARDLLRQALTTAGRVPTDAAVQRLQDRAGGQPYYLLNYADLVRERGWLDSAGDLTCSEDELSTVPGDIAELLGERLRRLPAAQLEVLQWGSVQGREFLSGLIGRVASELGRNAPQTMLQLAQARDQHALIDSTPVPGPAREQLYGFRQRLLHERISADVSVEVHDLVEQQLQAIVACYLDEGLLSTLAPEQRRRALRLLAEYAGSDATRARRAALAAGALCQEFALVQDFRAAEPWALKVWEYAHACPLAALPAELVAVFDAAFDTLKLRGDWAKCLELETARLTWARATGNHSAAAIALRNQGRVHEAGGEFEAAVACYNEALETARAAGDEHIAAKTLGQLAGMYHYRSEWPHALALYEESLAKLQQLGDSPNAIKITNNLALVHESMGNHGKALQLYQEVFAATVENGDRLGAAQTRNNIANSHYASGNYELALELYTQSLKELGDLGDELGCAGALGNIGATRAALGQHSDAIELLQRSLEGFRDVGAEYSSALTLSDLATSYQAVGRSEDARAALTESAALYRSCGVAAEAAQAEAKLKELAAS